MREKINRKEAKSQEFISINVRFDENPGRDGREYYHAEPASSGRSQSQRGYVKFTAQNNRWQLDAKDLQTEYMKTLEEEFEKKYQTGVRVKKGEVKLGSLIIDGVMVSFAVKAAYDFFKDYKDIREGLVLFYGDIRKTVESATQIFSARTGLRLDSLRIDILSRKKFRKLLKKRPPENDRGGDKA